MLKTWMFKHSVHSKKQCANVSPALTALSRHWRDAGGWANTSSVASHHDTFVVTQQSVTALVSE